jgi:predicted PolB exonuclease-like 3'-5' exonuclease
LAGAVSVVVVLQADGKTMLENLRIQNLLVLDIETVPQYSTYIELPERWKKLWDRKASLIAKNGETPEEIYGRAGIYSEFGKIICISVGVFKSKGDHHTFRIKSYYGHDEKKLLIEFGDMLQTNFSSAGKALAGHNAKEFDFPYLCRRMLINDLKLPYILDISGKKPWEVNHIDSMDLWKFGDYKNFTSLDLLAAVFDIPTPKENMDGSQVYPVYYIDKDLERIKTYCEKDVVTLGNILLRFKGFPVMNEKDVEFAP